MKIPRIVLFLFVLGITTSIILGCTKEERSQTVSVEVATVYDIRLVNSDGVAVTRVYVENKKFAPLDPKSVEHYDFLGYHPEIFIGQKATRALLLQKYFTWFSDHKKYVGQLCVDIGSKALLCSNS